jgi:GNAT superfamily N-acetyltransferase
MSIALRTHVADAASLAEGASAVLQAAWLAPSLDYTPEHLRWQLTFPGPPAPVAVTAWDNDRLVGFGAATPRRARISGWEGAVYVKSFMSVAPSHRGRGIGARVRVRLLEALKASGAPVVRFGEVESGFVERLNADYASAGLLLRCIGKCPVFAARPTRSARDSTCTGRIIMAEEFLEFASALPATDFLRAFPDARELAHQLHDPWSRVLLAAGPGGAQPLAVATAVWLRQRTPKGTSEVRSIQQLHVRPGVTADALRALINASLPANVENVATIVLPNLAGVELPLLSAAGIRRSVERYWAFIASSDSQHPIMSAGVTNLEIT